MRHFVTVAAWASAVLGLAAQAAAQPVPWPGPHRSDAVFADDSLPVVRITIDPADLAFLLNPANQQSDAEFMARFEFESPHLSGVVDSVGFRLRGNTSRASAKKSFRVSFNAFTPGGKFRGLEKLNLNGEHNDPSIMRAKLAWDLFGDANVPASRANHVALWINGTYYGLMMNVEQIDEQFLQRWFGGDAGSLYKCLWPADLTYRGPTGASYQPTANWAPYVLERGPGGYEDLARLVAVIDRSSDAVFRTEIERVLDVDGLLRAMAVIVATGSWDSYWFLKNNFYLYNDPIEGRFRFIPYDMDNSFGIWWDGIWPGLDWGTRNPYAWGHPAEPRPLMTRLLQVPEYRERLTLYLRRLVHGAPWAAIESKVAALRVFTDAAAEADLRRVMDYEFTIDDYRASFTTALANVNPSTQGHVKYGLLPFLSQRRNSLFGQLDTAPIAPMFSDVTVLPAAPRPSDALEVLARVEDEGVPALVEVEYWLDRPQRETAPMAPAPDVGPDWWRGFVPALGAVGTTDVRIRAVDAQGNARTGTLRRIAVGWTRPPVYINEFMALGFGTPVDEAGDADDWVELHNGGPQPVDLAGWFLSDDRSEPTKWVFPPVSIVPGGFLVVWTDGEPAEGPLHATFRLSGDGESVVLTSPGGQLVDAVDFGPQAEGVSWARTSDGGPDWSASTIPTPGATNAGSVAVEPVDGGLPAHRARVGAFPNPFRDALTLDAGAAGPARFEILDLLGRRVRTIDAPDGRATWDGHGPSGRMARGVYFVRVAGRPVAARAVLLLE